MKPLCEARCIRYNVRCARMYMSKVIRTAGWQAQYYISSPDHTFLGRSQGSGHADMHHQWLISTAERAIAKTLGCNCKANLLVPAQDVAYERAACQGLVDLHARATRVGEQRPHALPLQALHHDVGALARLIAVPVQPLLGALAGQRCLRRLPCCLQLQQTSENGPIHTA